MKQRHRKTQTNVHALRTIRTHDRNLKYAAQHCASCRLGYEALFRHLKQERSLEVRVCYGIRGRCSGEPYCVATAAVCCQSRPQNR
jgi:hypothetical protein